MSTSFEILPNPCDTCPYRKDTPPGIWDKQEYDKLPQWDDPMAVIGTFGCHNGKGKTVCRGWFEVHKDNLSVRIVENRIKWNEKNRYPTKVPLYRSGAEARRAGLKGIKHPPPRAMIAIHKIKERRATRKSTKA